ncbi:nuclear transport factor 2 family protein [Legionella sp. PATHC035]|uniref:nuclear transport factor 2 family protein n=1 Tax=Legionella sp. PATHC035 TaxID=2992040 RepID=UPI002244D176|nr:nuclear transport factor 2 family protein [Legionella sp. PATHC035]MCW8409021.1 nuclear transport factor 2 family protein [Legionella sp. PATHC035]
MKRPEIKPAEQLFKQFCDGYEQRNLPLLLSLFTQNSNVWGSALDEYRIGLKEIEAQFRRDWSQSEQGKIEIIRFVPTPDDALWAAAICNARITIEGSEHLFEHLRGTLTIEKEEGIWKIAHMHCSFPDYRNPEQRSFPVGNE